MNPHAGKELSEYSPLITIELIVRGQQFNVASLGPDNVILRSARSLQPGTGIIRLMIDGHLTTYHVNLPQGIDPQRNEQPFVLIDATREAAA